MQADADTIPYEFRVGLTAGARRMQYERITLDADGVVVGDRRIAWAEVASIRQLPWALVLRDGAVLAIREGRPKFQSRVAAFVQDAARRIAHWNAHAPEGQRIERDLERELAHVHRQIAGMVLAGVLGLALLLAAWAVPAPIPGMLYLVLIFVLGFVLVYGATMMGKRLTLLALRRDRAQAQADGPARPMDRSGS